MIKYKDCLEVINKLRFNQESSLFAVERDKGIIATFTNLPEFIKDVKKGLNK